MALLAVQKAMLRTLVQSMYDKGIVNSQFMQLQELKDSRTPDIVVRSVALFGKAVQNLFTLLSVQLERDDADFNQIEVYARELFERSSSIGAGLVKTACTEILVGCQAYDKDHCRQALILTKREFCNLRRYMEILLKMERTIIDVENGNDTSFMSFSRF